MFLPSFPYRPEPSAHLPEGLALYCWRSTELLKSIDTTKSTGPDGVSGKMLKWLQMQLLHLLLPSSTFPFIATDPQKSGKEVMLCQYLSRNLIIQLLLILGRFHCSQSWANDLRSISTSWYLIISLTTIRYQMDSGVFKEGSQLATQALLVTTNSWLQQLEQGRDIAAVFFDFI